MTIAKLRHSEIQFGFNKSEEISKAIFEFVLNCRFGFEVSFSSGAYEILSGSHQFSINILLINSIT